MKTFEVLFRKLYANIIENVTERMMKIVIFLLKYKNLYNLKSERPRGDMYSSGTYKHYRYTKRLFLPKIKLIEKLGKSLIFLNSKYYFSSCLFDRLPLLH